MVIYYPSACFSRSGAFFVRKNRQIRPGQIHFLTLPLRFRDLREGSDLKQRQIAEYLHCDQSQYSKYERGERPLPLGYAIKLAQFYHTSVDYLAGLTDEKQPYPRSQTEIK